MIVASFFHVLWALGVIKDDRHPVSGAAK